MLELRVVLGGDAEHLSDDDDRQRRREGRHHIHAALIGHGIEMLFDDVLDTLPEDSTVRGV